MTAITEEDDHISDDDVPENVHHRLLGAISSLYKQKRVKAPVRKESSYKVSEFHLTNIGQSGQKKGKIKLNELTKVLHKRAGLVKIDQQIKDAKKNSRKLPKPLERIEADKVQRSLGYENLKKNLHRWDAIVYQQRAAEHVSYPLKVPEVRVHNSPHEFLQTFTKPTELELALAESIDDEMKRKKEVEETKEQNDFSLSLKEMKEQRSIMARLRAQLSYREAKAARQNRIKSKKFHRLQKREKIKQQIKEFEELQKTDPEAALKKLEQLEKSRAQERASLRHRTTGQWARNLATRAKHNKDARIALSEQLKQSRDLTQKVKADSGDEDEKQNNSDDDNATNKETVSEIQEFYNRYNKYEDDIANNKVSGEDEKNMWINKEPISEVYNSCKKYQEEEINKKSEKNEENCINNKDSETSMSKCNNIVIDSEEGSKSERNDIESNQKQRRCSNTYIVSDITNKQAFSIENNESKKKKKDSVTFHVSDNVTDNKPTKSQINKKKKNDVTFHVSESTKNQISKSKVSRLEKNNESKIKKTRCITFHVSNRLTDEKDCDSKILTLGKNNELKKKNCVTFQVSDIEKYDQESKSKDPILLNNNDGSKKKKIKKRKNNKLLVDNTNVDELSNNKSPLDFDDMFYEVEEKMIENFSKRVKKLKDIENENKIVKTNGSYMENDDFNDSLMMKRQKLQIDIDEELDETPNGIGVVDSTSTQQIIKDASTILNIPESNKRSSSIEPNSLPAKPKKLLSSVPSSFADAEYNLDDADDDDNDDVNKKEKPMTISEAFACDDVEEEFKHDKEEEIKKSQIEDVNLTLPGWGMWGGPNLAVPERKKRRFITKFPKNLPRRDENKGNVVINEDKDEKLKPHLVTELPFPFTSVKEYEATIRAPIGSTFLPESAHRKLIAPTVTTKLGSIIEPMTRDNVLKTKHDWK